jgi:dipeptidyl aminopeptidase/acylaminoacyl peptidase
MKTIGNKIILFCFMFLLLGLTVQAEEAQPYELPPKEIADLIDTPGSPFVMLSPDNKTLVIVERPALPPIKEVSQPELKLAGLRINPRTNGQARTFHFNKVKFKNLKTLKEYPLTGLPEDPRISNMSWSPNGQTAAFTLTRDNGLELWMAELKTGKAIKLTDAILNGAMRGRPFAWLPDSKHIIFKAVIKDRGNPPEKDLVPKGPVVQSNVGKAAPVRTYQDLLKSKHDEALFKYYTNTQLMMAAPGKEPTPIGKPGIISRFSVSPDGSYILVELTKEPFSYLVPYRRFPMSVEIWDTTGKRVKQIADIPLAEDIPKGYSSCRKGPRNFAWRADVPAELYWAEAQDDGDPKKKADIRDKVFSLNAPFTGTPKQGPALKYRYGGISWGTGTVAMVHDWWWKNRTERTVLFQPDFPDKPTDVIFDLSWEDRYKNPGFFTSKPNKWGKHVLLTDKKGNLYLRGAGASPEGNRPFIDSFNLKTKKSTRLWRSKAPYYEQVTSIIDIDKHKILTQREGKKVQPNYFIRNIKTGKIKQVTQFPHPFPTLKDVEKQFVEYKREDGVDLNGDLYLPPDYNKSDGPLPVLMWAYPREFKSKAAAGQRSDSPYRFIRLYWGSPLLWITQGYAVFNSVKMPIVGEGDVEPNDTYVKQLVGSAKAAIDKLAEMGVGDPKRVAIGGHSYGAFMTANLLAHSRLFAAGIARSGAYNRTLTPFGFQAEERTFWEAPDTYFKMSPFMHADKVKDPLLLIHGQADNNSGTFPIQSERFYHALKGHGATVRMVLLPHESHGYRARESIMHLAWETYNWLEKYVKPRGAGSQ